MELNDIKYCPLCGKALTEVRQHHTTITKSCPESHLWDIWQPSYGSSIYFEAVKVDQCKCGKTMPVREMREIEKTKVCPECFAEAKKQWRMDKEKSFARLEITPVQTTDGLIYNLKSSIKIEPYPNPFMYGGMYGSVRAKNKEELLEAVHSFEKTANELRQNGMEKVEIITHDEVVRTEQPKLETAPNKKLEPEPKPKAEVKQLSLLT